MQLELALYQTPNGKEPFRTWYESLAQDHRAFFAITRRLTRLRAGNYGHYKSIGRKGSGPLVLELLINVGPGYRIYCARVSPATVLLLGGGSKRRQQNDIKMAKQRMTDYKARRHGK